MDDFFNDDYGQYTPYEDDLTAWEERQVFEDQHYYDGDEADEGYSHHNCDDDGCEYDFSRHCGAHVCIHCDRHKGLVRCYCGWAESGGDGRDELRSMGENI